MAKHLTEKQKAFIECLKSEGYSLREVAKKLAINHSTVSRVLSQVKKKNETHRYSFLNCLKTKKDTRVLEDISNIISNNPKTSLRKISAEIKNTVECLFRIILYEIITMKMV